jgi:ribose 5-phosphate isomerase B
MIIALGSDHAGYRYKEIVKTLLTARGHEVLDFGTNSTDSCDYPDYIRPAAQAVADGRAERGLVFGGSGNGEAIVANKVRGIRCGLCWNVESTRLTRLHNNANVISIGERMVDESLLPAIVDTFVSQAFEGGRHVARIAKIE